MRKRSSTTDVNQVAVRVVNAATVEESTVKPIEKNPYAVALGRLGGLKGGIARKRKLSAKRRSEIAAQAANARWKKRKR